MQKSQKKYIFSKKLHFSPFLARNFFEGPLFSALGEGTVFWTLGEGHPSPIPPPRPCVGLGGGEDEGGEREGKDGRAGRANGEEEAE